MAQPHPTDPAPRDGRAGRRPAVDRVPFVAAAALLTTSLFWATRLAVAPPAGWSATATFLFAADLLLLTAVAVVGLLVARARWSGNLALVLAGAATGVGAALSPIDGWWWAGVGAMVVAGAALQVARTRWLRRFPRADGPPVVAVVLTLLALATPAVVAIVDPAGPAIGLVAIAAIAVVGAVAYSRATAGGLWTLRLLPAPALAALATGPSLAAGIVSVWSLAVAWLAWRREARVAVTTPTPTSGTVVPMPPELVPKEVLDAAGLDERGRPIRRGRASEGPGSRSR